MCIRIIMDADEPDLLYSSTDKNDNQILHKVIFITFGYDISIENIKNKLQIKNPLSREAPQGSFNCLQRYM